MILSKIFLDSTSLDRLIARPHDDRGPIHEFFFSDETKYDGIFVRESYDPAAAVITGWRTYELTNGWEGNLLMRWRSFVVSQEVPTDVPDGSSQFTYLKDGIDTAVGQAVAVAGKKDVKIIGGTV